MTRYKGVEFDPDQSPTRQKVVEADIDRVIALEDVADLLSVCRDAAFAPEARRLAAAQLLAMHELAAEERSKRPKIDPDLVKALVAGLRPGLQLAKSEPVLLAR